MTTVFAVTISGLQTSEENFLALYERSNIFEIEKPHSLAHF